MKQAYLRDDAGLESSLPSWLSNVTIGRRSWPLRRFVALFPLLPLVFARLAAFALFTAAAVFVPFISLRSCDAPGVFGDCYLCNELQRAAAEDVSIWMRRRVRVAFAGLIW